MERDLGSLEFLKVVWSQKVILYFREKFLYGGYKVLPSAQSFRTLKNIWYRQMERVVMKGGKSENQT